MQKDEAALDQARQVSAALAAMTGVGRRCPVSADPFDWSSDVLDELARAVTAIEHAVAGVTGTDDDEIRRYAGELATAIVRRRNDLLGS